MALYTDIFGRLDWLTTRVKRLCCSVDQVKEQAATAAATQAANNPCYIEIIWNDIANASYRNLASYVAGSTYDIGGTPFTGFVETGNIQRLYGGSNIILSAGLLGNPTNIVSINDPCGTFTTVDYTTFQSNAVLSYINLTGVTLILDYAFNNCSALSYINFPNVITISTGAFKGCQSLLSIDFPKASYAGIEAFGNGNAISFINMPNLTYADNSCFLNVDNYSGIINFPKLTYAGDRCFDMYSCAGFNLPLVQTIGSRCFENCLYASFYNLNSCTNLGGTTGFDAVWGNVINRTAISLVITLTIPVALMTCDSGNPDGDIVYLIDPAQNNTVTIITV